MPTYPTSKLSLEKEELEPRVINQFKRRMREELFELVSREFHRLARERDFTKTRLAKRLGKDAAQITRWLRAPSNWEVDTVSELLIGMGTDPRKIIAYLDPAHAQEAARSITPEHEAAPLAAKDATPARDAEQPPANLPLLKGGLVDLTRALAPPDRTLEVLAGPASTSLEKLLDTLRLDTLGLKGAQLDIVSHNAALSIAKLQADLATSLVPTAESVEIGKFVAELEKSTAAVREQAAGWSKQFDETVLRQLQDIDSAVKEGTVERGFHRALLEDSGLSQAHAAYDFTQKFAATTYRTELHWNEWLSGTAELLTRVRPLDAPIKPAKMPPSSGVGSSATPRKQPRPGQRPHGAQGNRQPGLRGYRDVA